jgi:hypothetical protein
MQQAITLKKDGIYFMYWDESTTTWLDKEIQTEQLPISWYLQYPVQADENVTVRDILLLLKPYIEHIQLIFANSLEGVNLSDVYDMLGQPMIKDTDIPINFIYLFKIGEASPIPEEDYMFYSMYPVLMGVYESEEIESEDIYHLSSYDIRIWCDLPFAIDGFFEYTDLTNDETVMHGITDWTLYEVILGILSQLAVSLQITKTIPITENSTIDTGPVQIAELLTWLEDLDRILLSK